MTQFLNENMDFGSLDTSTTTGMQQGGGGQGGQLPPPILVAQKAPPAAAAARQARRLTTCPPRFLDFATCLRWLEKSPCLYDPINYSRAKPEIYCYNTIEYVD